MNLGPSELTFDGIKKCTQNPNVRFWGATQKCRIRPKIDSLECKDPSCDTSFLKVSKKQSKWCVWKCCATTHPIWWPKHTFESLWKTPNEYFYYCYKMKQNKLIDLLLKTNDIQWDLLLLNEMFKLIAFHSLIMIKLLNERLWNISGVILLHSLRFCFSDVSSCFPLVFWTLWGMNKT